MKEIKEMLESYLIEKATIKNLELDIKRIESDFSIGGSNFEINGDIRPKGYMANSIENQIINKADKVSIKKAKIEVLKAKIELIDSLIESLREDDRDFIKDYYIIKKSTRDILKKYMLSDENSIYKKIKRILCKMCKNYNKISKNI